MTLKHWHSEVRREARHSKDWSDSTFCLCWMEVIASGWNSSLSVRHSFQYRMEMMTMTTRRGITTPMMIHMLVFSVSDGEVVTFSTAIDKDIESFQFPVELKTQICIILSSFTYVWGVHLCTILRHFICVCSSIFQAHPFIHFKPIPKHLENVELNMPYRWRAGSCLTTVIFNADLH